MKRDLMIALQWALLVLLAIVVVRFDARAHDLDARIAASQAQSIDALALHTRDSLAKDSLARESAARDSVIVKLSASATASNAKAANLRSQIADMRRPLPTDSTNPQWQHLATKYDSLAQTETQRADSIGKAFALLGVDRNRWKQISDSLYVHSDSLATALRTSQSLVHDLKIKAATAGDCHILRYIPCPTRTQAAVGSMLVTAYIATHTDQTRVALHALTSPFTH